MRIKRELGEAEFTHNDTADNVGCQTSAESRHTLLLCDSVQSTNRVAVVVSLSGSFGTICTHSDKDDFSRVTDKTCCSTSHTRAHNLPAGGQFRSSGSCLDLLGKVVVETKTSSRVRTLSEPRSSQASPERRNTITSGKVYQCPQNVFRLVHDLHATSIISSGPVCAICIISHYFV